VEWVIKVDVNNGKKWIYLYEFYYLLKFHFSSNFSYEFDRMSSSGSTRNYRDSGYQQQYPPQQRGDNYNNQQSRRANNFSSSIGNRGRRGVGGNSYRGGTQSDAGTGGKLNLEKKFFL